MVSKANIFLNTLGSVFTKESRHFFKVGKAYISLKGLNIFNAPITVENMPKSGIIF